ncbi:MAG: hypothetical protein KC421_24425 [Anaerolineales bacterium]|nr:hypothetical protein [Anaerolineales bacterium]
MGIENYNLVCWYCGSMVHSREQVIHGVDSKEIPRGYCSIDCLRASQSLVVKIPKFETVILAATRMGFVQWLDSYMYIAGSRLNNQMQFKNLRINNEPLYASYNAIQYIRSWDDRFCTPQPELRIDMDVVLPTRLEILPLVKAWGWPCLFEKGMDVNAHLLEMHFKDLIKSATEAFPLPLPKQIKSKRGPRRYSKQEKMEAYMEWQQLDKDIYPIKLEDWLEQKFGSENGILNVKTSTFHGWKKLLPKLKS